MDGLKLHLRPQSRLGQAEGAEAAQLDVERIQRDLAAEMPELAPAAQLAREQPGEGEATPDVVRQVCLAGQELCEYLSSTLVRDKWLHRNLGADRPELAQIAQLLREHPEAGVATTTMVTQVCCT